MQIGSMFEFDIPLIRSLFSTKHGNSTRAGAVQLYTTNSGMTGRAQERTQNRLCVRSISASLFSNQVKLVIEYHGKIL